MRVIDLGTYLDQKLNRPFIRRQGKIIWEYARPSRNRYIVQIGRLVPDSSPRGNQYLNHREMLDYVPRHTKIIVI